MDISPAPGGAAEPQGQVVQGGGQLPSVRGVGQGRVAGKPGKAPGCFLPDMLVSRSELTNTARTLAHSVTNEHCETSA